MTEFIKFATKFNLEVPLGLTIGKLLNAYNIPSLAALVQMMDVNGGYSILGPSPDNIIIDGCEFLALSM